MTYEIKELEWEDVPDHMDRVTGFNASGIKDAAYSIKYVRGGVKMSWCFDDYDPIKETKYSTIEEAKAAAQELHNTDVMKLLYVSGDKND